MKLIQFEKILLFSALLLACCGAYFSIVGVTTLFSGAMISVGIMAAAIELGKLCAVTFLYRYWKKTTTWLKFYMGIASIVLILITSVGISAFLLSAYQKSSLEYKANQDKIVMIDGQKTYLNSRISQSQERIKTLNDLRATQEARLTEALTNAYLTRNPIQLRAIQDQTVQLIQSSDSDIKSEQQKIQSTSDEIETVNQQVNDLKFSSANKKDIRTFQFIADQFGTSLDNVAKWFIIALICVFDPLAVALILAYNVSTYKEKEPEISIPQATPIVPPVKENIVPNISTPTPIPAPPIPQSAAPGIDSGLKRMFKL